MKVTSPLSKNNNTAFIRKIPTQFIIEGYKNGLGIDVGSYFKGLDFIELYKCIDTGMKFFHPIDLMGDSSFYEQLQNFEWYYMDWKWENEIIYNLISQNQKILEIGSGNGSFVKKLSEKGFDITGLELNQATVEKAKEWNCEILGVTVGEHSENKKNYYDVVCSFQVMEHIPKIFEVINESVLVLKPGGKLFISVPNDECFFFGNDSDIVINMPPHHCTRWNEEVMVKIAKIFGLKLNGIFKEPLQKYHEEHYHNFQRIRFKNSLIKNYYFLYENLIFPLLKNYPSLITGHTLIGEFTKK